MNLKTIVLSVLIVASCDISQPPSHSPDVLLERAVKVYLPLSERLSPEDGYPRSIEDGVEWQTTDARGWTSGFFPGILWQLFQYTHNPALAVQARRWTEGLAAQKTAPTHDVGFIIFNSFGHGFRSERQDSDKQIVLDAAAHLALRFNDKVGAIRSWDWGSFNYPVIIDNMMNLELLFWAAANGGDTSLVDIARKHAMTTIRDHIRPDGSTFHVVDYNPDNGEILWRGTHQGLSDSSTWARGQAWAIYGFAMMYRETREPIFLETACRLADLFLDRLPADVIPYWDFDAPQISGEPRDASAAAIASSGLWSLASEVETAERKKRYRSASIDLVRYLSSSYLVKEAGLPALLLHSTGNRPRNREVDVPIIYADYYFIETLIKQSAQ